MYGSGVACKIRSAKPQNIYRARRQTDRVNERTVPKYLANCVRIKSSSRRQDSGRLSVRFVRWRKDLPYRQGQANAGQHKHRTGGLGSSEIILCCQEACSKRRTSPAFRSSTTSTHFTIDHKVLFAVILSSWPKRMASTQPEWEPLLGESRAQARVKRGKA